MINEILKTSKKIPLGEQFALINTMLAFGIAYVAKDHIWNERPLYIHLSVPVFTYIIMKIGWRRLLTSKHNKHPYQIFGISIVSAVIIIYLSFISAMWGDYLYHYFHNTTEQYYSIEYLTFMLKASFFISLSAIIELLFIPVFIPLVTAFWYYKKSKADPSNFHFYRS